jgi:hypothetical protein
MTIFPLPSTTIEFMDLTQPLFFLIKLKRFAVYRLGLNDPDTDDNLELKRG